jgi:hypothetical protein
VLRDRHDAGAVCPSARVRGALIRARAHTCGRCLTPLQLSNSSGAARCRMRQIAAPRASQTQPASLALRGAATGAQAPGSRDAVWPCQSQRASPDGQNDGPYLPPALLNFRPLRAARASRGRFGSILDARGGGNQPDPQAANPSPDPARSIGWAASRPGSNRLRAPEMLARPPAAQYGPPAWRWHPSFFGMGTKGLLSISSPVVTPRRRSAFSAAALSV